MFCQRNIFNSYHNKRFSDREFKYTKMKLTYQRNQELVNQTATPISTQNKQLNRYQVINPEHQYRRDTLPIFFKSSSYHHQKNEQKDAKSLSTLNNIKQISLDNNKDRGNISIMFRPCTIRNNRFETTIFKQYFQPGKQKQLNLQSKSVSFQNRSTFIGQNIFKKSTAIMNIRKLQKKREESIQKQKEKMQEEFKSKRQVPIHHSQLHLSKKHKVSTQASTQTDQRNKNKRIISYIVKANAQLQDQNIKYDEDQVSMIKVIKGRNILKEQVQYNHKKKVSPQRSLLIKRKQKGRKAKDQENDFGPWKRANSNDFSPWKRAISYDHEIFP